MGSAVVLTLVVLGVLGAVTTGALTVEAKPKDHRPKVHSKLFDAVREIARASRGWSPASECSGRHAEIVVYRRERWRPWRKTLYARCWICDFCVQAFPTRRLGDEWSDDR